MIDTPSIVLAGRGPSILTAQLPEGVPFCAVSSGVFCCHRKPAHFVTMDLPKYFTGKVRLPEDHYWSNDPKCHWWPFLNDPAVAKHVPEGIYRAGWDKKGVPPGKHKTVDIEDIMILLGGVKKRPDLLGWQPGWADFRNVAAHPWDLKHPPNFGPDGPMGTGGEAVAKSVTFAVQLMARLGYRRMYFAGIDMHTRNLKRASDLMRSWLPLAEAAGVEWINLAPQSRLADWMPTVGREVLVA